MDASHVWLGERMIAPIDLEVPCSLRSANADNIKISS